jgi:hypothetical protein
VIVNYTFFQNSQSVEMSVCGVRCILRIGAGEGAEGLSKKLRGQWATVVGGGWEVRQATMKGDAPGFSWERNLHGLFLPLVC